MRNILEYPITIEEVIDTLKVAQEQYEGCIGGVQPVILDMLIEYVRDHEKEIVSKVNILK